MDDNVKPYAIGAAIVVILLVLSRGSSSGGVPGYRSLAPLENPAQDALMMQEQKDRTGLLTNLIGASTSLDSLAMNWAGRAADNRSRIDLVNAEFGGRTALANIEAASRAQLATIGAQRDTAIAGLNAATDRMRAGYDYELGRYREGQTTERVRLGTASAQDIARVNAQRDRDVTSTQQRGETQRNAMTQGAGVVNTVVKTAGCILTFGLAC